MTDKTVSLVVDMNGCPNRCLHCWLGHQPNRRMEEDADHFIMSYFSPYFEHIAYYSWLREPDFCKDYRSRWYQDIAISQNAAPMRFELASFYQIARDEDYIPFLKSVGVKKVQLTFFGLKETQDRYVGRAGAYEEVLLATNRLIEAGITPRWQCFLNEENKEEILAVYEMAKEIQRTKCPALEFFVHEGSCDGENRKCYPIRIEKHHIPPQLLPVYWDIAQRMTERACCEILKNDTSHPTFPLDGDIVLNISNTYDVYYNFTHMSRPWCIGNMKTTDSAELVRRITQGDTYALRQAKQVTWAELTARFGDPKSEKVFSLEDYKMFLFNNYLQI